MKSYWIWNYGDFELYHSNLVNSRREQYGAQYPPFWKLYDVERNVKIYSEQETERDGWFVLHLNGIGSVVVDDVRYPSDKKIILNKGKHFFKIDLVNFRGLPCAYIESDVIKTDPKWYTKTGKGEHINVGWNEFYDSAEKNPEKFNFSYEKKDYVSREIIGDGILFDFGKELFGFLYIDGAEKEEKIHVSYGESREEALDVDWAIVREDVTGSKSYKLRQRGFRYIYITGAKKVDVYAELEYLPLEYKGSFECNEKTVNDIWDMCAYTLKLNAREVYTEAVKRDRWLWGGDAYQEFKFNKYLFFDKEIVRRSLIGLRGKEPFDEHINTITDYSLFWVIALWEYYQAYADIDFVKYIYPYAESLMNFCFDRTDEKGFIVGKNGDWIFIDWSDIDKTGAVCAEQMLYIEALRTMGRLASVLGVDGKKYNNMADDLLNNTNKYFWNEDKGAYIDSFESGKNNVTRHANIFAVMYDIASAEQKSKIINNVLLNDNITKITTPYFEGYELDAMGKIGNMDYIYDTIVSYWKGMLDLGATTVWEEYNQNVSGVEHYAMYGDKYGKSLCHAWGASPIYLLGKYYIGVEETSPGFDTFTVKPYLGKFEYIKGTVPVKGGEVRVFLSNDLLSVTATKEGGTLIWNNKEYNLTQNVELRFNI